MRVTVLATYLVAVLYYLDTRILDVQAYATRELRSERAKSKRFLSYRRRGALVVKNERDADDDEDEREMTVAFNDASDFMSIASRAAAKLRERNAEKMIIPNSTPPPTDLPTKMPTRGESQFTHRAAQKIPRRTHKNAAATPSPRGALALQRQALDAIDRSGSFHPDFTGEGVTVYVLDSGCDRGDAFLASYDVQYGPAFVDENADSAVDAYGHGTFVALLVARVAPRARLVCAKIFDDDGYGSTVSTAQAMLWAADDCKKNSNACVLNLSGGTTAGSRVLNTIADELVNDHNIVGVYAAGNYERDRCVFSPASAEFAVSVGATTLDMQYDVTYSAWGACVDVSAPGTRIVSSHGNSELVVSTGTSMSAAFVSGAMALARQKEPRMHARYVAAYMLDDVARRGILSGVPLHTTDALVTIPSIEFKEQYCCLNASGVKTFDEWRTAWTIGDSGDTCVDFEVSEGDSFAVAVAASENQMDDQRPYWHMRTTGSRASAFEYERRVADAADVPAQKRKYARFSPSSKTAQYGFVGPDGLKRRVLLSPLDASSGSAFSLTGANFTSIVAYACAPEEIQGESGDSPPGALSAVRPCSERSTVDDCAAAKYDNANEPVAELRRPCSWVRGACVAVNYCAFQNRNMCNARRPNCRWNLAAGTCSHT